MNMNKCSQSTLLPRQLLDRTVASVIQPAFRWHNRSRKEGLVEQLQ